MIATGLCMMGGCFAQDDSSFSVDTYWPAHAVHIEDSSIVVKEAAEDLCLPFWVDGMKAGGRLENIIRKDNTNNLVLTNWGLWDGNYNSNAIFDGLYFSICRLTHIGPLMYSVCGPGGDFGASITQIGWNNETYQAAFMEGYAEDNHFIFRTEHGEKTSQVAGYLKKEYTAPWVMRFRGEHLSYDVVSFWWENAIVQKRYFMLQPMKSAQASSAFFIHGYDILTEI